MVQSNLGLVGIVSKGTYSASTNYVAGNFVYYNGSTYLCINNNGTTGIAPGSDENTWQILARGAVEFAFTWGDLADK